MKKQDPPKIKNKHQNATARIFFYDHQLRQRTTEAENVLWEAVKGKQLGVRFRRQHPVQKYIADFYCHSALLVVELDGGYHDTEEQKKADQKRTDDLEASGLTVIRFRNEEVLNDIEKVLEVIRGYM